MVEEKNEKVPRRESDDPLFEEYKEELLNMPISTARDENRLAQLEARMNELITKVGSLEKRVQEMEKRS